MNVLAWITAVDKWVFVLKRFYFEVLNDPITSSQTTHMMTIPWTSFICVCRAHKFRTCIPNVAWQTSKPMPSPMLNKRIPDSLRKLGTPDQILRYIDLAKLCFTLWTHQHWKPTMGKGDAARWWEWPSIPTVESMKLYQKTSRSVESSYTISVVCPNTDVLQ